MAILAAPTSFPPSQGMFVDDGDVTTDKKLGLERFRVAGRFPALICQMYRGEIILHVKRVLLGHVIAIFNQSVYHRLLRKKLVNF